jgi:hypothetical protein
MVTAMLKRGIELERENSDLRANLAKTTSLLKEYLVISKRILEETQTGTVTIPKETSVIPPKPEVPPGRIIKEGGTVDWWTVGVILCGIVYSLGVWAFFGN